MAHDLEAAAEWYSDRSVAIATSFLDEFDATLARLRMFPRSGSRYGHGTRVMRVRGFPFYVVYVLTGDHARIIAVGHQKRGDFWEERL